MFFKSASKRAMVWFDDEFVCLVRKGHPHVGSSLTSTQFVTLRHGVIKHGPVSGLIERLLTKAKVNRDASRKPLVASDNQRDLQPPLIDGLTKPCEASFRRLISAVRLRVP
jgi:hypothetical protein